ncbi:hypothetical protein HN51_017066 [Arachis hypogaea]|uniref:tetrahydroanabasine acetyltransferase n=2 Tax=Arachis hypogaea TaxID=3818 RepID=UPI000DED3447|nr:uncharacterized protein LOC112755612 [Arachis hypogaea]QHO47718.1 Taxadien-5-alpha-ol O-acetyltransferase [Arachis hypogaea]
MDVVLDKGATHDDGHSLPKVRILAVKTVAPVKETQPRLAQKVLLASNDHDSMQPRSIVGGCYQVVFYYNNDNGEESDWSFYGWIVESLCMALVDYPILAARLLERDTGLEIVSIDSGFRLLSAQCQWSLSQFLDLNERHNDNETELVYWKEIDETLPQFSPLCSVQVTKFECGGYSIGISCSLFLLTEVLAVDNFLKKWTEIYQEMLPQNGEIKKSIFIHPLVKDHEVLPSHVISRTFSRKRAESMIFKITSTTDVMIMSINQETWRELAMLCVKNLEQKHNIQMGSKFSFLVKKHSSSSSSGVITIESCSNNGGNNVKRLGLKYQITLATWNEFGLYNVAFCEANKPVHVSCWVASSVPEGHVMAMPHPRDNLSAVIIVTPPTPN